MQALNRKIILSPPNLITFGRIAVIPVIAVLMMYISPENSQKTNINLSLAAAFFFILAGISDLIDGHFARKYKMVSLFGKFFDPMADKLIHMTVMVLMIPLDRLPAWLVVILLFREIFITGLRSVAAGEGIIIDSGDWGKKKTAWTNVALAGLLIWYPIFGASAYTIGWISMGVAVFYNLISGVQYTVVFFKDMKS